MLSSSDCAWHIVSILYMLAIIIHIYAKIHDFIFPYGSLSGGEHSRASILMLQVCLVSDRGALIPLDHIKYESFEL